MKYICKICGQIIDNNEICPFCGSDSTKIEPLEKEEHRRYRCLNCGHEIDNNEECPFCGAKGNLIFDITPETAEDDNTTLDFESYNNEPKKEKVFEFCEGDECEECEEFGDDEVETIEHECSCHSCNEDEYHCCLENETKSREISHEDTKITANSFAENLMQDEPKEGCSHCGKCEHEHDEENHQTCSCCGDEEPSFEDVLTDLLTVYGHLYKTDYEKSEQFKKYIINFLTEIAFDFDSYYDYENAISNLEDNVYFKEIINQFKK